MPRQLLISNSLCFGRGYLDHCEGEIREVLGARSRVLFVPYALFDLDSYASTARERLFRMGYELDSMHTWRVPSESIQDAEAIFVGGGNTFLLLERFYHFGLLRFVREAVLDRGIPYIGSSAGSNLACVSIKTTNDMPIVWPPSLDALNLVPLNINPHYIPSNPASTHMGENRDSRIQEFHMCNDPPVVGLREGSMLDVEGSKITLRGSEGARIFVKGQAPKDCQPNTELGFLYS